MYLTYSKGQGRVSLSLSSLFPCVGTLFAKQTPTKETVHVEDTLHTFNIRVLSSIHQSGY